MRNTLSKQHFSFSLIWKRNVVLFILLLCSGCNHYVRLPAAPVYPKPLNASSTGSEKLYLQLQALSPKVWKHIEHNLGIQKATGKIYIRLFFKKNKFSKCQIRRSDLRAEAIMLSKNWQAFLNRKRYRKQRRSFHKSHSHPHKHPQKSKAPKLLPKSHTKNSGGDVDRSRSRLPPPSKSSTHKRRRKKRTLHQILKGWRKEAQLRKQGICRLFETHKWKGVQFSGQQQVIDYVYKRNRSGLGLQPPPPRNPPPKSNHPKKEPGKKTT